MENNTPLTPEEYIKKEYGENWANYYFAGWQTEDVITSMDEYADLARKEEREKVIKEHQQKLREIREEIVNTLIRAYNAGALNIYQTEKIIDETMSRYIGKRVSYTCSHCNKPFTINKNTVDLTETTGKIYCSEKCLTTPSEEKSNGE